MDNSASNNSCQIRLTCRHGFYLRITEDEVEGSKDKSDQHTTLEMMSVAKEGTVFRGKSSKRYVGMNDDGNLLTYRSLIEDCVFTKQQNRNGYSCFESRPHAGWYLALKKDGRPKPGPKTASGQRAIAFLIEPL